MTRADKITQLSKQQVYFSDFPTSFARHPILRSLTKKINEESVKQSIRNLILTDRGERPFQPELGSNVRATLFDLNDGFATERVMRYTKDTIEAYERRAEVLDIKARESDDGRNIMIDLVLAIVNNPDPIELRLIVKRVR